MGKSGQRASHAPKFRARILRLVAVEPVLFLHLLSFLGRGVRQRRARRCIADDLAVLEIHPVADVLSREMNDLTEGHAVYLLRVISDLRREAGAVLAQLRVQNHSTGPEAELPGRTIA